MRTNNSGKTNYGIDQPINVLGRLAKDVLYTEFMPKGVIKYEPSYLTNSMGVAVGRGMLKLATMGVIANVGLNQNPEPGPVSLSYLIPSIYFAADTFSALALWAWNTYKNFYENLKRWDETGRDNLENHPSTIAIELPYNIVRGGAKVLKQFVGRKVDLPKS